MANWYLVTIAVCHKHSASTRPQGISQNLYDRVECKHWEYWLLLNADDILYFSESSFCIQQYSTLNRPGHVEKKCSKIKKKGTVVIFTIPQDM